MTDVAVVGLGLMGQRIARRLLHQGYRVHVWNRTGAAAEALAEAGAEIAETPSQAADRAGTVITMVADGAALRAVVDGPDGIGACPHPVTVLQMSTVSPEDTRRLADLLPTGSTVVDSPVLGSVVEAESGTLQLLVGASEEDYRRCLPLLGALGTTRLLGPPGAGTAAKLVANSALFGVVGVLGESLRLARTLGLAADEAFEVLAATPLAAQAERRRPAITENTFPPRFTLSLARKDADLVAEATIVQGEAQGAAGERLRLAEAMRGWLRDAEAAGLGALDYTAVLGFQLSVGLDQEQKPSSRISSAP